MNTLVGGYLAPKNEFQLSCYSKPIFPEENNNVLGYHNPQINDFCLVNSSSPVDESSYESRISCEIYVPTNGPSTFDESSSSEGECFKDTDHSDAVFKFISQMLMEEEDLENKPCMLHDCLALQATEKSLYDALNNNHGEVTESPSDHFAKSSSVNSSGSSSDITTFLDPNWSPNLVNLECRISPEIQYPHSLLSGLSSSSPFLALSSSSGGQSDPNFNASREKKNRIREDGEFTEENRRSKQLAGDVISESEPLEIYDQVLLCSNKDYPASNEAGRIKEKTKPQRGRPRGGNKQGVVLKEVVDLRSLLMQCAQAVASYDSRSVNNLLIRIRQHSSPIGDGTERMAHYFANALEARLLVGNGRASSYAAFSSRISAAEILRGYQTYIMACPFRKISNMLANKTIKKLASKATALHVIDFGILYGFQWPCLIQALSERPSGPPKLRITGIDFPQSGFRPAERVEDTGRRLAKYCERFGVPFEYNAIAQKWETIKVEDLKIKKNEVLVVNSLYRSHNVLDETVMANSPRDTVLTLIKKIDPDLFIHGVVNGAYNTPFFVSRFKEALFHFSSLFDMFEAAVGREDPNRVLFEKEVYGMDVMNVIACEGTERVDRPETYKQWQVRNVRAGFRQVGLDREIVEHVRRKVRVDYHKDFSADEDGKWMLQGWKGRVLHAISCWKPAHK